MSDVQLASIAHVRHVIARAVVRDPASIPEQLGDVTLRPAQRDVAARLAALIALHGGAMLAEPVGLGKTYTALAVAALADESILIVVPASLRTMWTASLDKCRLSAAIVTHEALSAGASSDAMPDLVIVDEAHRLRSPGTRRYATLAHLCRRAKVLLVTATPVQNRRADLAAQLALFLGRGAWQMTDAELAQHVVRDSHGDAAGQPRLSGPHSLALPGEDDCLDAVLALPPPVPAKDESLAVALVTYGLIHQWTSSRAALVASLERRRARGMALMAAVESGRRPTRAELSAWTHAEDSIQLAFPELVVAETESGKIGLDILATALARHDAALRDLLRELRSRSGQDPDAERAAALRRIRDSHPGERIIAFCHYAETVNVLRSRLAGDAGVAALTARGARVAGGRITRDDVLAQFTPRAHPAAPVARTDHISLLITTDLLSEGLNLQEASVIVHLDLPWNPARLEQRVGRARRFGSRHDVVTVYAIAPPTSAERLLRIHARLRDKLGVAEHAIGVVGPILPTNVHESPAHRGLAEGVGALHAALRAWIKTDRSATSAAHTIVATVDSTCKGYVALVRDGARLRIVADVGAGIDTAATAIQRAVVACNGDEAATNVERVDAVLFQLEAWLAARRGAAAIDPRGELSSRSRRSAMARVARALAAVPRHRRTLLAPLAAAARVAASASLAEGAERLLDTLILAPASDEAWLKSLAEFAELNARPPVSEPSADSGPDIVALILLQPPGASL